MDDRKLAVGQGCAFLTLMFNLEVGARDVFWVLHARARCFGVRSFR